MRLGRAAGIGGSWGGDSQVWPGPSAETGRTEAAVAVVGEHQGPPATPPALCVQRLPVRPHKVYGLPIVCSGSY